MTTDGPLQFAERLLSLVDAGRYTATYKLATLLAIVDVAAEHVDAFGVGPRTIHGREVAKRVIELYWPQTPPYGARFVEPERLSQSKQNDIPSKLGAFRDRHSLPAGSPLDEGRRVAPAEWDRLEQELIATVIRMPLAKLQRFGEGQKAVEDRFIYDFSWRDEVSQSAIARPGFDDSLHFRSHVGDWLVRLAPLLRPLVQAKWSERVARLNPSMVDTDRLDDFLFGASRISLARVRQPLLRSQDGRCFYCLKPVVRSAAVDHFIPWSRYPDNDLDNLVAAHQHCNQAKSASIAGLDHLERLLQRYADDRHLAEVAELTDWPRRPERTLARVRAVYFGLQDGAAGGPRLWVEGTTFASVDRRRVAELLSAVR